MLINFECQGCQRIFDSDVGQITFQSGQERPTFEHPIRCPSCGPRTMDQVWLTETGQGQLTQAVLNG
jgi:DNA-directed RNA polymerase subunit RPC12/RpoP